MPDRPQYTRSFAPRPGPALHPNGRGKPRRWTREGFIPFRLEVLTPVFIGSGGDLSPLDYVIRQEGGNYTLHLVDTESWLLTVGDREDIRAALDKGDMLRLRRLMDEQLDTALHSLGRVPVPSSATAQGLLAHIRNPRSLSNAEVQPFVRNPATMTAFVPGSSLKGALSTPLIDELDHGDLRTAMQQDRKTGYAKKMKYLFGDIREHAMQALKVSDIPVPPGGTRIVAAVEIRRETGKSGTPKSPCETLPPSSLGGPPLHGRLFMDMAGGEPRITLPNGKAVSRAKLAELCNAFYGKRFHEELKKFYSQPHLAAVHKALQPVLRRIEALDPEREILLRVGHYSHVECVTVSANAPQCSKGFGKTRTLADRELPFGWVLLSFCTEAEYSQGLTRTEEAIARVAREQENARAAREADMRRALDEQRKRIKAAAQAQARAEEERQRREREVAERAAQLAALSPEERAIAEVAAPDATEERSMALFARLGDLDGELRARAASALRDCWQRLGKWEGKLSKKQVAKVAEVKRLLEG